MYDSIIIGGGPAGLAAAIYTCRKKMKTLVLTMDIGGQTNLASHVENYPGVDAEAGMHLMRKFENQARRFGAEIKVGKVEKVKKGKQGFSVFMSDKTRYEGLTVIVASGKVPRTLNVPGEDKFMGRGVSTCVTCDAPLFRDKVVAVIGGGNSAVEGAMDLSVIAKKVYLIHRREEFRADEYGVQELKKEPKIEIVLNSVPKEVKGSKFVECIVVEDVNTKKKREIELDGVFVEIGYVVDNSIVKGLVEVNKSNEIVVDNKCGTSCPGIFAAGDVTSIQFKQTIIAAGEGAKAALCAHSFVRGTSGTSIDWQHYFKKE